jgi:hypothetical protein
LEIGLTDRRFMKRASWREAVCLGVLSCVCLLACEQHRAHSIPDPDLSIPIDSLTVYSLDGNDERGDEKPRGEMFHSFQVLGKVDIASPKDRTAILAAIKQGMAKGDQSSKCFWPRHGVKFTQAGKILEYLICFQCNELQLYTDGVQTYEYTQPTADTAHPILDRHLTAAGIPLQEPK